LVHAVFSIAAGLPGRWQSIVGDETAFGRDY
jgi:hypothetical protein